MADWRDCKLGDESCGGAGVNERAVFSVR